MTSNDDSSSPTSFVNDFVETLQKRRRSAVRTEEYSKKARDVVHNVLLDHPSCSCVPFPPTTLYSLPFKLFKDSIHNLFDARGLVLKSDIALSPITIPPSPTGDIQRDLIEKTVEMKCDGELAFKLNSNALNDYNGMGDWVQTLEDLAHFPPNLAATLTKERKGEMAKWEFVIEKREDTPKVNGFVHMRRRVNNQSDSDPFREKSIALMIREDKMNLNDNSKAHRQATLHHSSYVNLSAQEEENRAEDSESCEIPTPLDAANNHFTNALLKLTNLPAFLMTFIRNQYTLSIYGSVVTSNVISSHLASLNFRKDGTTVGDIATFFAVLRVSLLHLILHYIDILIILQRQYDQNHTIIVNGPISSVERGLRCHFPLLSTMRFFPSESPSRVLTFRYASLKGQDHHNTLFKVRFLRDSHPSKSTVESNIKLGISDKELLSCPQTEAPHFFIPSVADNVMCDIEVLAPTGSVQSFSSSSPSPSPPPFHSYSDIAVGKSVIFKILNVNHSMRRRLPSYPPCTPSTGNPPTWEDILLSYPPIKAHRLLNEAGLAPKLHGIGIIHSLGNQKELFPAVIMEDFTESRFETWDEILTTRKQHRVILPQCFEQVAKGLILLHQNGIVLGDLRPGNLASNLKECKDQILNATDNGYPDIPNLRTILFDFDWSEIHQKARYPLGMNAAEYPVAQMAKNALMDFENDIFMYFKMVKEADWDIQLETMKRLNDMICMEIAAGKSRTMLSPLLLSFATKWEEELKDEERIRQQYIEAEEQMYEMMMAQEKGKRHGHGQTSATEGGEEHVAKKAKKDVGEEGEGDEDHNMAGNQ